jgi:rhodanese-related sulfurtransferase
MARLIAKALVIAALACVSPALSAAALTKEEQAIRNVPRISIDELKALMEKNAVLVIDVRTPEEFAKGRIPGAVNVDYTLMLDQAGRFKSEARTIVTYCACSREMTSARAAVDLAAKGVQGTKALVGGWDEWVQRGEKVER